MTPSMAPLLQVTVGVTAIRTGSARRRPRGRSAGSPAATNAQSSDSPLTRLICTPTRGAGPLLSRSAGPEAFVRPLTTSFSTPEVTSTSFRGAPAAGRGRRDLEGQGCSGHGVAAARVEERARSSPVRRSWWPWSCARGRPGRRGRIGPPPWLRLEISVPLVGGGSRSTTSSRTDRVGRDEAEVMATGACRPVFESQPDSTDQQRRSAQFPVFGELSMGRAKTATTTAVITCSPAVPRRPSHSPSSRASRPPTPGRVGSSRMAPARDHATSRHRCHLRQSPENRRNPSPRSRRCSASRPRR